MLTNELRRTILSKIINSIEKNDMIPHNDTRESLKYSIAWEEYLIRKAWIYEEPIDYSI
jgi:hypothetical protein